MGSTGGIFQLVINIGEQDKILNATNVLQKRLKEIDANKLAKLRDKYPGRSDDELRAMDKTWMPTLQLVEESHVVFTNASFKPYVAMGSEYMKCMSSKGFPTFGSTVTFTLPVVGQFINDMVVNIRLSSFSAITQGDRVRWTEFVGHRLLREVRFKINNNPIDSYGTDEYNAYYQFKVPINKQEGYLRCIGQEIPYRGYLTADPSVDNFREYRWFGSGPQTFKQTQEELDLFIPMLFWFREIQSSLPNFLLSYGQTDIEIDLESIDELVSYAAYVGTGAYTPPKITKCELYSNQLFILPDIFKIFIKRFGFQLIRVHNKQYMTLKKNEGSILLNQLNSAVEALYFGFRPQANLLNSQTWHRMAVLTQHEVPEAVITGGTNVQVNDAIYYSETPAVNSIELRAHDMILFHDNPITFYNSYTSYRYGRTIKTPVDIGWNMLTFAYELNDYQPSGHFNVSRAREFYLRYSSSYISSSTPTDLICLADTINFLLISDSSGVLRYST